MHLEPDDQSRFAMIMNDQRRQQVGREHRRDDDRNQQRSQNGNDVSDAERHEQPPFDAGQREQRDEDQRDDQGRIDDRRAHLQRGGNHRLEDRIRLAPGRFLAQPAQDVLDIDHRIVDQLANRNRQPAQRHRVDRQPQPLEDQYCDQDRERDGSQRNQHGAQVAEEKEQHSGHQTASHQQLELQVADRRLNEISLAENHLRRRHALWHAAFQVYQRRFDAFGQVDRIGCRLFLNAQQDRRHAAFGIAETAIAALDRRRETHFSDLAKQDGLAVTRGQREIFQIIKPGAAAEVTDQILATIQFEKATRGIGRKSLYRRLDLIEADAQRRPSAAYPAAPGTGAPRRQSG
jgi:hypothetical protein